MTLINQLQQEMEAAQLDADKFYNKNNRAAGVRVRKNMQTIKQLAQQIRVDINTVNKAQS